MRSPYVRPETRRSANDAEAVVSVMQEKYERCHFCHSKLVFSHDLNPAYLEVIETGRCPGCGVSMSPKKYTLQ